MRLPVQAGPVEMALLLACRDDGRLANVMERMATAMAMAVTSRRLAYCMLIQYITVPHNNFFLTTAQGTRQWSFTPSWMLQLDWTAPSTSTGMSDGERYLPSEIRGGGECSSVHACLRVCRVRVAGP